MYYGNQPFSFIPGDSMMSHHHPFFGGASQAFQPTMWNQPMSFAAPWNFSAGFTSPWNLNPAFGASHPQSLFAHTTSQTGAHPHGSLWSETHLLSQKLDLMHQQIIHLTELANRNAMLITSLLTGMQTYANPYLRAASPLAHWGFGMNAPQGAIPPVSGIPGGTQGLGQMGAGSIGMSYEMSPIRIRETEAYLCWEIPFQGLSLNDVEVEVLGNRIICRTRAAIPPMQRFWNWSVLPAGIQVFELPDGRVECSCVVPVAFDAKEVEAVFKEGGIAIYVPKIVASERQNVRVGKDAPQYVTGGSSSRKNVTASQHS